ncbi:AraC family transcriptional regulator [Maricurvus nonylphenolicus]|uniref:AraC family transcriptional regulator n=1 Tax=Maricurvus nonylphenolicus TaxID=1008307 RepID=UPI0036F245D6
MTIPKEVKEIRISAANPAILVDYLKEKGFSEQQIFEALPIKSEILEDPSNQIFYYQYLYLIKRAFHLTGDPGFGLEFGCRLNSTGSGLLGLGALACPNLIESMHFVKRCAPVLNAAVRMDIHVDDDYLHVDIKEELPWEDTENFMVDVPMGIFATASRMWTPDMANQIIYQVKHAATDNGEPYKSLITGDVQFNSPFNRVSFPIAIATRPTPFNNPSAVKQAEEYLEKQIQTINNAQNSLLDPIKQIIKSRPGHIPGIEEAAEHFHVSSRTLNRRLKTIGTNYKDVVSEVRKELAIEYLAAPKLSIDEIASLLAYKDSSNFSKAFRNWTGYSPSQYRENNFNA